jgi:serine/threonine-protein kinase
MPEVIDQRYQLVKLLGSGGTGEVWRAFDLRLKREVAIKRVIESRRGQREALVRLLKEAEHLARVDHPNVVVVHDSLEAEHSVSIVMELVRGMPLVQLFRRRAVPELEYLGYFRQVLAALEAVHAVDLIHRDINPRNVLVSHEGVVKLTDFGLSGAASDPSHRLGGTLAYMAPECMRKGARIGFGVDIYSLGFMSYQALLSLVGFKKLYGVVQPKDWVRWVLSREPFKPLTELGAAVSPGFSSIIGRMLEKEPAERYQRVSQVKKDLEGFLAEKYPALLGLASAADGEAAREGGGILGALRKVTGLGKASEPNAGAAAAASKPAWDEMKTRIEDGDDDAELLDWKDVAGN